MKTREWLTDIHGNMEMNIWMMHGRKKPVLTVIYTGFSFYLECESMGYSKAVGLKLLDSITVDDAKYEAEMLYKEWLEDEIIRAKDVCSYLERLYEMAYPSDADTEETAFVSGED